MLEHLSFAHPDTIALYSSMADAYEQQNKLDEALHMLSISVDIMLTSAECNPRDLIDTYKHMARIYRKLKKFEEASVMLNKCHEIEAAYPSSENFNLENVNIDALFANIFRSDNTS
jgi:tetratricopeptide (TPR) repeat protein